jgi:hypothetical protein
MLNIEPRKAGPENKDRKKMQWLCRNTIAKGGN